VRRKGHPRKSINEGEKEVKGGEKGSGGSDKLRMSTGDFYNGKGPMAAEPGQQTGTKNECATLTGGSEKNP